MVNFFVNYPVATFVAAALALGTLSCGSRGEKGQSGQQNPSPAPGAENTAPKPSGSPGTALSPAVETSNKDVRFALAQVVRSGLPSISPSNSAALFAISASPIEPQASVIKLVVKEVRIAGPGYETISDVYNGPIKLNR